MESQFRRKGVTVLAAATAGAVAAAIFSIPAFADTSGDPAWEPDPAAVGTITFYDNNGDPITSGPTNSGTFAAYAVGSDVVRAGDTQAGVNFANPDPDTKPVTWFRLQPGLFTANPLSTAPASIKTLSQTHPVAASSDGDLTLEQFQADSVQSTAAGYKNVVQVRLRTADVNGQQTSTYDDADLLIDATTHTWTQIYPGGNSVTQTTTSLKATPNPVKQGGSVKLTATEKPATAGSVQFKNGSAKVGGPVAVNASGVAVKTIKLLQPGNKKLSAVFTPTDSSFTGSSASVTEVVKRVPDPSGLTIGGPAKVKRGAKAAITGKLTDTKTHKAVSGQVVKLFKRPAGAKKWALVKKAKTAKKGTLRVLVKLTKKTSFQWRYAGGAAHKAVNSKVKTVAIKRKR
jgi:hypothetical protein